MSFIYQFKDGEGDDCYFVSDNPILVSEKEWTKDEIDELFNKLIEEYEYLSIGEFTDILVDEYDFKYLEFNSTFEIDVDEYI